LGARRTYPAVSHLSESKQRHSVRVVDKIVINRGWLEQTNALPPICLRTGVATDGNIEKRKISTAPAWAGVFVVFGGLGMSSLARLSAKR
jgi:hypothetical protein